MRYVGGDGRRMRTTHISSSSGITCSINTAYTVVMSAAAEEELKIRCELEMEVERDLEAEIKDGIYHLALRLHRLYQHQKERNQERMNNKTLYAEVNINIRLEGGTKIEIKEIKKDIVAREHGQPLAPIRSEDTQGVMRGSNAKNFDWAKSLRSEARRPLAINKKNDSPSNHAKVISYEHGDSLPLPHQNHKLDHTRRKWTSASGSGQQKRGMRVENKLLELGWKC
ncbi:hypothetical protein HYC85_025026 [Camellia sinensis]|uniref:Uncharacterized protein n=1 Tax=Camellia sinensis TaxID=4442 RepID=A0A7J7G9S2_CAMSI|nr:hypothetical protein HYC85_025026 [Camellia sinensis]